MRPLHSRNGLALALVFACGVFLPGPCAQGSSARINPQGASAARAKQSSKGTREAKARELRERRQAIALLLAVAEDARALEDAYRRADLLTLCAEALWEADEQSARTLFGRAWEAATEADEEDLKVEREMGRGQDLPESFTRARGIVLTSAARSDAPTAETFLSRLGEWLKSHESSGRAASEWGASRDISPLDEFSPGAQRLTLAFSLLGEDSYKSAASAAEPALAGGVSGALVEFLLRLRAYNANEADRLYLRLLKRTRADARSDTNDVLLLSSYALTPRLLAVTDRRGSVQFRALGVGGEAAQEAASASRLARAAFFDAAAPILLRPTQQGGPDAGANLLSTYFAVGRLLPFFEQEAPHHAPALHARMSALAAEVEAGRRASLDSQMKTRSLTAGNPVDPLRPLLDEVERASDPGASDAARGRAVDVAVRQKLWDRARRLADGIEGQEERDAARFIIAARQVASLAEAFADGEEDDVERAAAFARQAGLSPAIAPALRAYGLAVAAELASQRGKRERAAALLDEAIGHAQQAESGTGLRTAAALMVATTAARLDSPRAWETLAGAVAAVNEDKEFSDSVVQFAFDGVKYFPGERETLREVFEPFGLEDLFAEAAAKDFGRAAAEARMLKHQAPRAYARLAAARAVLEKRAGGVRRGPEKK